MAKFFQPANKGRGDLWWGETTQKNSGPRILALCFMAAMVEAGDA